MFADVDVEVAEGAFQGVEGALDVAGAGTPFVVGGRGGVGFAEVGKGGGGGGAGAVGGHCGVGFVVRRWLGIGGFMVELMAAAKG